MTLERLIMRCDSDTKIDSLYIRDPELTGLTRHDIDMAPVMNDTVYVPHFTKQARPCFDYLKEG